MKRIFSVLVENRSGVLCKVSGLFARRSFNIDSLAVGETNDPDVSCMTIVSSGSKQTMEQIEKQLNKKLDVIKIKSFENWQSVTRELILYQAPLQQVQPGGNPEYLYTGRRRSRGCRKAHHDDSAV